MKNYVLFIAVITLISGCESKAQLAYVPPTKTVVAFGDSLTYGTGARREQSYPAQLSRLRGAPIINAGVPGNTTADGLTRIDQVLQQHNPALLILCLGGNDFLKRQSSKTTRANLTKIIDKAHQHGAEVVLIAVPKLAIFPSDSDIFRQVASEKKVPLLENELTDLLTNDDYKSDAIHLNARGYQLLAEALDQFIRSKGGW